MNGIKLKSWTLSLVLLTAATSVLQAVNIWPDKIEPPTSLREALQLARQKIASVETDNVYCLNATLRNGDDGNSDMGYWIVGFSTELGNSYSVAVRMDARVSLKKVKEFKINAIHPWPDTITPPISIESALTKAKQLILQESKDPYYCLNATLVTSSNDVVSDGMWNFVFQTRKDDPKMINIRMNGKTGIKDVDKIRKVTTK